MIFSILKYGAFVILCFLGIGQTYLYYKLKKNWKYFPVVAATITKSELFDLTSGDGVRSYEAKISFKYSFLGKDYECDTPALRSPQVFPLYEYESTLLDKYKVGEMYNAKVHPNIPEVAFLEIAPLSKLSVFLLPLIIFGYFAYLIGIGWYFTWTYNVFTN